MRRNDDCGSSFRNRDNGPPAAPFAALHGAEPSVWIHEESLTDMKATIYHNPMCGTSRKTLEILRESGADVWVREYLKNPPSPRGAEARFTSARASRRARDCAPRNRSPRELGLTRPDVTDDEILDAMVEHPILIKRPLVETDNGVRLCRPQDLVREIL